MQEAGERPGLDIERFMLRYGDLIIVNQPSSGGFPLRYLARQILRHVSTYREVTLDGISGGAKLAQEVIRLAQQAGLDIKFRLILDSAPSRMRTLVKGVRAPAIASLFIPYFPSSRRFNRWFYKKFNGGVTVDVMPSHAADLSVPQMIALREHQLCTLERSVGMFIAETRALIMLAPRPDRKVLQGIPAVFIRSARDELIEPAAFGEWNTAIETCGNAVPLVEVDSEAHVDHLAYPSLWLGGYERVYNLLGLVPLH